MGVCLQGLHFICGERFLHRLSDDGRITLIREWVFSSRSECSEGSRDTGYLSINPDVPIP